MGDSLGRDGALVRFHCVFTLRESSLLRSSPSVLFVLVQRTSTFIRGAAVIRTISINFKLRWVSVDK
jgi:hypothetical protein